jgi:hypothetical protein
MADVGRPKYCLTELSNSDNFELSVEPPTLTPEDEKKLQDANRAAQDAN